MWDLEQGFLVVPSTTLPLHQRLLPVVCSTTISGTQDTPLLPPCPLSAQHSHQLEVRAFLEVAPRDPGVGGQEVQAAQAAWPLTWALQLLLLTLGVINMGRTVRGK